MTADGLTSSTAHSVSSTAAPWRFMSAPWRRLNRCCQDGGVIALKPECSQQKLEHAGGSLCVSVRREQRLHLSSTRARNYASDFHWCRNTARDISAHKQPRASFSSSQSKTRALPEQSSAYYTLQIKKHILNYKP